MKPRFQIGDAVFYRTKARNGTISSIINLGEHEDVQLQGYRYYVLIDRILWSIPESLLILVEKNSNKIKANSAKSNTDLPQNTDLEDENA